MRHTNNLWPAAFHNLFAAKTKVDNKREDFIFSIKATLIVKLLFALLAIKQLFNKKQAYTN